MLGRNDSDNELFDTEKYDASSVSSSSLPCALDPCVTMPCGPQGRCLPLNAAPKGYMCMCQSEGISYTTIDTCPSKDLCEMNRATCHLFRSNALVLYAHGMQERWNVHTVLLHGTSLQIRTDRLDLLPVSTEFHGSTLRTRFVAIVEARCICTRLVFLQSWTSARRIRANPTDVASPIE